MIQLGRFNTMTILRETTPGLYLEAGEDFDGILLPRRYVTPDMMIDDTVDVFVYKDSEDRPVATTVIPLVQVGQFANLQVVHVMDRMGAFLDWGLSKDLLLPISEQGQQRLQPGDWVIVAVYVDTSDRIVATTRIDRHFTTEPAHYRPNDPVDVLIYGESPLGYKAIVNQTHSGLIYRSETSDELNAGDEFIAYVSQSLPDGKIDLRRDPAGYDRVESVTETILRHLHDAGGSLAFNDKSPPDAIRATFGTSKKAFKQALGALYKQRQIRFTETGIETTTSYL
ncbi:MAG: S1-like domain-containing RNA-binding protein [Algisphaera sp.]